MLLLLLHKGRHIGGVVHLYRVGGLWLGHAYWIWRIFSLFWHGGDVMGWSVGVLHIGGVLFLRSDQIKLGLVGGWRGK